MSATLDGEGQGLMRHRIIAAGVVAAGIAGSGTAAMAQQPLPNAPRNAVSQMSSSGFYVWVDGSVQRINLPNYQVGPILAVFATGDPIRPLHNFDQKSSGQGIAGAAGYVFRDGTFTPGWGSNVRVELGVSWIEAEATGFVAGSFDAVARQLLNGLDTGVACIGPCTFGTTLHSDYQSWQFHLKAASDFRMGAVTLTPAIVVFAGDARNRQTLVMSSTAGIFDPYYRATTSLEWHDWGARAGLDGKLDVAPWLTLGLGGTLGAANRDVDFTGNDVYTFPLATSSVSRSADTTAFLANAEASVTLRPAPALAVRGFVGLNYDSKVPGVSPGRYAGSYTAPTSVTPAGIRFSDETSYYAGGGMVITFAP